jgi:hypothetical protein
LRGRPELRSVGMLKLGFPGSRLSAAGRRAPTLDVVQFAALTIAGMAALLNLMSPTISYIGWNDWIVNLYLRIRCGQC